MSASVEKLKAARDLVARPDGWAQGAYAKTANGNLIDYSSERAVCWCSEGALFRAGMKDDVGLSDAYFAFKHAIGGIEVPRWNDTPGRTQAEVVAAFDRAIALAEAEASS